jgi:acyl transferase domain-containing protein/phosphopantetheinyl transferase
MTPVAIVGMACVFPGAADLDAFRHNLEEGVDAIRDAPPSRIDPVFFDATSRAADRFYCRRGGFIDGLSEFDATSFGVMPLAARTAEPDQLLTLQVAARALGDAGYDDRPFARDRAAVILGRGGYGGAGRTRVEQQVRGAEQLATAVRSLLPDLDDATLARIKAEFQAQLGANIADGPIGLVPNLAASRIANRLDLHGPAFTIDAACASALVAVDQACRELSSGRSDLVVAGGVHLCHEEGFWSVFCQLGALSRRGEIRPFDRRADGLVIGEGIGIFVLKRLADAERDGDRVYAVVRGCGTSSDGRGALLSPAVDGQLLALERAWGESGLEPESVGLVEAHGTATPAGDAAELATLARFFGRADYGAHRAIVGSVKSMIGHAMPAAGAAGLIKAALAIHHGILPPTLHCEEPHDALDATRFRVIGAAEPWQQNGAPRRAGVNAFGFGGINAHVVLEEHAPSRGHARRADRPAAAMPRIASFSAASLDELFDDLAAGRERTDGGAARCVVFDPSPERIARTLEIARRGRPWRGREEIWFSPRGLIAEGGTIAFVFPGVDASFEPRVDDVARAFGLPAPAYTDAKNIEETGAGIFGVNRLLDDVLRGLGVRPAHLAGHSIGEWSGMVAAGMVTEDALGEFVASMQPGTLRLPGVAFAAAGCGVARAEKALRGLDEIALSHDNCPHQIILCGREASIDVALQRLRADGVLCEKLPFRSGFHSPLFAPYLDAHRDNVARLPLEPPRETLWSATTCAPYPREPAAIKALAMEHLVRPVRFRELIERLHAEGARIFVQVGTGSLVNFVEDSLRGHAHVAVAANVKERTGLEQLRRLLAALFIEGADVDLARLSARPRAAQAMSLALGVPLLRTFSPLELSARTSGASASNGSGATKIVDHPLADEFARGMDAVAAAQRDVLASFATTLESRKRPLERTTTRTLSVETMPELMDHCFFNQPPGWKIVDDLRPVVPMTTSIDLMLEHAQALVPGKVAIGLDGFRAYRWLVTSSPVEVSIAARYDGIDRVHVRIGDYCEATVVVADSYPDAPAANDAPLQNPEPSPVSARGLYEDRWMFHGPAFAGIATLEALGSDGICGDLAVTSGRGALLDSAGQLFGFWVMMRHDHDRSAMPIGVARLRLFGPHPREGERLACTVRVRSAGERSVVADMALSRDGRDWARIEGWEDRRFETDEPLWALMRWPEHTLLAEARPEGFTLFEDRYRGAPTREQLTWRFLGESERADYERQGPRRQRSWLNGRIAAKDAVRDLLWRSGHGPLFPIEVAIANEASGRPVVRTASGRDVRVSIAHKGDIAVALARQGHDAGIDVERIEPREDSFAELSFTPEELRLVEDEERDAAWTLLWAAKEAGAKARGTGLGGDPLSVRVQERRGARLLVDGVWIETARHRDHIIAWTEAPGAAVS